MIFEAIQYEQSIFWLVSKPRHFEKCMSYLLHCLMNNTRPECPDCGRPMACFAPKGLWGDYQYWCDDCSSPHADFKYDSYGRLGRSGFDGRDLL